MVVATKTPKRTGAIVPINEETIALIYSRVSTDEQGDEGVSLPAQVGESRRYNSRQPDWIAGEEFQDVESGRRDDRSDYQRLLMTARDHALAGRRVSLTVASLDRLGRNIAERVRAYEELKALGIPIHSVREGGIVSEFTYNILAAVAQEESRKLGERVRASIRYVAERGWHPVGRVSWGYRWRPATADERAEGAPVKVLEPHPVEAPYARAAWERLVRGESVQSIARWSAALPSEVRGGRNLRFSIVRTLLRAPVYVGRLAPRDGDVSDILALPCGRWDPLISDETWTAAQAMLALGNKMPRQASGEFPLTGLIRCYNCGSRMGGRTNPARPERRQPRIRSYICTSSVEGAKKADLRCHATATAAEVERAVLATIGEILEAVDRPKVREAARRAWAERQRQLKANDDLRRISDLERDRATTRRRISALSVKFLDGQIDRTAYDIVRADLATELDAAENELARLRGRARPTVQPLMDAVLAGVGGWASAMRDAAPGPIRQALGVLIERIEPVRVARGKYEARIDWTPIGWYLLGVALQIEPSENILQVDRIGQP